MVTKRYSILDLALILTSDSEEFLSVFDADYAPFAISEPPKMRRLFVTFFGGNTGNSTIFIDGVPRSLVGSTNASMRAYQILMTVLMRKIQGYTVIHGGVVAKSGNAIVISGPSGSGKTTLVAALLKKGFQFLSDEFCPIHRETHLVHPYPRTMRRKMGGDGTGGVLPVEEGLAGKVKVRLDPLSTTVESLPCRVKSLIYIDPDVPRDGWKISRIHVEHEGEEILARAAEGMKGVAVKRVDDRPFEWEIKYRRNGRYTSEMTEFFKALEPHALKAYPLDLCRPDFSKEPALTVVASHEMAHTLLKELKSAPDQLHVKPGQCFARLVESLSGVPCWRITPGRLDAMVELVISTLDRDSSSAL